jgi:hypothetical protein
MRKHFLDHYWHAARELNGFDTTQSYVAAVLKHEHITTWKKALTMETSPGDQTNCELTAEEYAIDRRVQSL